MTERENPLPRGRTGRSVALAVLLSAAVLVAATCPAAGQNLIENSSFEVGTGHGWGRIGGAFYSDKCFDSSTAVHGKYSVKAKALRLVGKWRPLAAGTYTVSCYLKADAPTKVRLELRGTERWGLNKKFDITTGWKRYHITGKLPSGQERRSPSYGTMPDGYYSVGVYGADDATVWVDAVQVNAGELADYAPCAELEMGFRSLTAGNVFYVGEPSPVRLCLSRGKGASRRGQVSFEVTDYYGRVVDSGTVDVPASKGPRVEQPFPLFVKRTGVFRLIGRLGGGDSVDEMVYSVFPRPKRPLGQTYEAGTLGGDNGGLCYEELEILKRANFSFLIHKHAARWSYVERVKGSYRYFDESVANAEKAGLIYMFQAMAVQMSHRPEWVKDLLPERVKGGKKDWPVEDWPEEKKKAYLKAWSDFVFQMVKHYRGRVKYWEMENEPYYWVTNRQYAEILKTAYIAAKKADPDCIVVGCCNHEWKAVDEILKTAGPKYCDVVSGHFYASYFFYPEGRHGRYAEILKKYGKKGFNTETGGGSYSLYSTLPAPVTAGGRSRGKKYLTGESLLTKQVQPWTRNKTKNYLLSLSRGGLSKYFIYNMRFNSTPRDIHCDPRMNFLEYDGGLKAAAVGMAMASHFIDGADYVRAVAIRNKDFRDFRDIYLWRGRKDGATVGAMWAPEGKSFQVEIALADLELYDIMGARLAANRNHRAVRAQVGGSVVYLRSKATPERVAHALATMKLTTRVVPTEKR